jgi:hypothetical protein
MYAYVFQAIFASIFPTNILPTGSTSPCALRGRPSLVRLEGTVYSLLYCTFGD